MRTNQTKDIKANAKEDSRRAERRRVLLAGIEEARTDIELAQMNLECVYLPDEVDTYIYRLRAAQSQYGALLKKLKEL